MIQETFVAVDAKSAYKLALEKYGENVELISAKQIQDEAGKFRSEVTFAVPKRLFIEKSLGESVAVSNEDGALLAQLNGLKQELSMMKEEILQGDESVVLKAKSLLEKKGIAKKWLDERVALVSEESILEDDALLVSYLLEEIDENIHLKEEEMDEPKIVMLVGPTGVGKTTTIAKLAARYAYLMERPYKVALLNLDSYKIGAFEQLAHYADIMQIEHRTVQTLEAFQTHLETFKGYDVILVDTAGMSPYDTEKFIKTVEYVQTDIPRKLEVNLVISATVKYEDMDALYQNFSFLNLNSVIISKFDETKHLGTLLNFMLLYHLPMSYFSIGQEVPDDLMVASKEYLLEQFIGDLDGA
ncbi:MAG: hypothetical protein RLZZ428_53 [Pseudomonadota bacterium]|jgi:flagellar biosynthesis protein FlhF